MNESQSNIKNIGMRKIIICSNLIILVLTSCSRQEYYTKDILAQNVIKALQEDDINLFKKTFPSFELVQKVMKEINYSEYNQKMTEMFIESQNVFSKKGYNIRDFEISIIYEPYKVYEYEGFEYISFEVLIKNKSNFYLTVDFSDCIKTETGYKIGESLTLVN